MCEIEDLIEKVKEKTPNIFSITPDFQTSCIKDLLAEYLAGNSPLRFSRSNYDNVEFSSVETINTTEILFTRIVELSMRVKVASIANVGVEWDRQWAKVQEEWKSKQERLINLLSEAADLFWSTRV